MPNPLQSRLKELFDYDSETGFFTRKITAGGEVRGARAGNIDTLGYIVFAVDGRSYKAHRLAWLYTHGYLPPCLDHVDGVPSHNWISNLRPATMSQNKANSKRYRNNQSGIKGVRFYPPNGKWLARIGYNGQRIHLGYFSDRESARHAYLTAADKLFGEFARAA